VQLDELDATALSEMLNRARPALRSI